METLFHHRVREIDSLGDAALDLANEQMLDSVLRTYFLPRWEFGVGGQSYDISGLGGFGGQETSLQVAKWENINTDNMKLKYENFVTQPSHNVPFLDGKAISLNEYIEDLVAGFRQMYRFLMAKTEALLSPDSPLAQLAPQRVRFIFRHTKIYSSVLKASLNPKYLRDGADFSIELDLLSKAMLGAAKPPIFWSLLEVEKQALAELDIPLFTASSNSDSLAPASGQIIEKCFAQPSYDLVISRLKQLDEDDLETQVSFIWGSMYASSGGEAHRLATSSTPEQSDLSAVAVLTPSDLVEQSIKIAHELRQRSIYSGSGSATWISLAYITESQQYQLLPMGYRLFDGCTGVALFLAALEKVTGGAGFRDLALAALAPLRRGLSKDSDRIAKEIGIGGGMGCGSLIYGLVRSGQFLGEDLLPEAKTVAALITSDRIASDRNFDVLGGSAGAILGLLTLYEVAPEPKILQQAIACGQHLLNHRVNSESGFKVWATMNNTILTGFSHGAAGIAYALLRLYQVSGENQFLQAALESHAYETSVFIPEKSNWPDFRFPATKQGFTCWCSWCHGAPGIGLARVAELDILPAEKIQPDIDAAINTTKQQELNHLDQLCCGNLGRVELLLTASKKLHRSELMETALKQASQVVNRAEQKGRFGLNWDAGPYNPSFFQGTTGIGYQLLRLAYPDLLPSVLVWE
jgi:type 2 lantibiotic biosynthesis protein LanM